MSDSPIESDGHGIESDRTDSANSYVSARGNSYRTLLLSYLTVIGYIGIYTTCVADGGPDWSLLVAPIERFRTTTTKFL